MIKTIKFTLVALLLLTVQGICAQSLEKGVSKQLAERRKAAISNVKYNLTFNIPSDAKKKVLGEATITFDLSSKEDVILDFQGQFSGQVLIGKKKRPVTFQNEHIIIPFKFLKIGNVELTLEFICKDDALNRNGDYLYTIFVPDHARSVFPCFDQPDLRARFETKLNVPKDWKTMTSDGRYPIPTYLYSFVAGNFQ
jgi:aminopeptidase N